MEESFDGITTMLELRVGNVLVMALEAQRALLRGAAAEAATAVTGNGAAADVNVKSYIGKSPPPSTPKGPAYSSGWSAAATATPVTPLYAPGPTGGAASGHFAHLLRPQPPASSSTPWGELYNTAYLAPASFLAPHLQPYHDPLLSTRPPGSSGTFAGMYSARVFVPQQDSWVGGG